MAYNSYIQEDNAMRNLLVISMLLSLIAMPAVSLGENAAHIFITATDLHYLSPALTDNGPYFTRMIESGDGKVMRYCDALTDAFIDEVIARQPGCLILSGDLTFNGARRSHEDLAAKLFRIREAGIPVLAMPGNHDMNMRISAAFSGESYAIVPSVTAAEFAEIYHDFGFADAISRDTHSLSYIAEPVPGVCVVMLDTNTPGAPCSVAAPTFAWLDAQLTRLHASGKKIIAVSHQNLFAHSDLLSKGYVIENAQRLLALYIRCGVAINLSGHMHLQHTKRSLSGFPEAATSSLSVSPCQYGVLELSGDQGTYHTESVDVSAWARRTGQTDENLLDFAAYAYRFFTGRSREQITAALSAYGAEDAAAMADFSIRLNYAYFSGRLDTFQRDARIEALWAQENKSFWGLYVASMLRDADTGVCHARMTFDL